MLTLLITVSGKDSPGITAEFSRILSKYPVQLSDVAQTVLYQFLSLSFLVEVLTPTADPMTWEPLSSELKRKAEELQLRIELQLPDPRLTQPTLRASGASRLNHYAVTIIAERVTANTLHEVSTTLAQWNANIDVIKRLSENEFSCVEILVSSAQELNISDLRKKLLSIAHEQKVDIAFQNDGLYRRAKRLVVMDIDSTLIQGEIIDELAREHGVHDQVALITREAMLGQIDFDESLRQRCAFLKGLPAKSLDLVYSKIKLTPGAQELISVLKKLGYKTAVISGGFTFVADRLKEKLSIDFAYANTLEIRNGLLTGKVQAPIVNAQRKADLLEVIAQKEGIPLDQVVAIGDGANDVLMIEKAGLGIAFNAKPVVREKADLAFSQKNMRSILYLLGLSARDVSEAIRLE